MAENGEKRFTIFVPIKQYCFDKALLSLFSLFLPFLFQHSSSSKGNLDLRLAMTTFFSCKMSQNFTLYIFKTLFFECRIFICNHLVLVKTYKSGPIWTLYTEGRSHQKNLSTALLATHTKALGTDGVTKTDEFSEKFQTRGGTDRPTITQN